MRDVTTDRAYVRALQFNSRDVLQLVKPERTGHRKFVVVDLAKLLLLRVELVLDVANQLFEHVFQCHHSDGPTKFIHHHGEMCVLAEEQLEQFLQWHHLRERN